MGKTAKRANSSTALSDTRKLRVEKNDIVAAWALLEAIAVSVDQIGGSLETEEEQQRALVEFLNPAFIQRINHARMQLARYLSESEAVRLSDELVPYWNYRGVRHGRQQR